MHTNPTSQLAAFLDLIPKECFPDNFRSSLSIRMQELADSQNPLAGERRTLRELTRAYQGPDCEPLKFALGCVSQNLTLAALNLHRPDSEEFTALLSRYQDLLFEAMELHEALFGKGQVA